jgi:hypothetical protein
MRRSRILHLVVALDHVGIRWRRPFGLIRAALSASLWSRCRRSLLRSGCVLLPLSAKAAYTTALLARELSAVGLASNGAVTGLSLTAGLFVGDDVVCRAALLVGDLLVVLVLLGVLEDDVPRVEEAGEHAETAEGDVYERICAADTLLHPYWRTC